MICHKTQPTNRYTQTNVLLLVVIFKTGCCTHQPYSVSILVGNWEIFNWTIQSKVAGVVLILILMLRYLKKTVDYNNWNVVTFITIEMKIQVIAHQCIIMIILHLVVQWLSLGNGYGYQSSNPKQGCLHFTHH